MDHRFIVMLGFVVVCAACSQKHEDATPAAAATAPTSAPALATTTTNASGLTYLYDLMQRPDFSTAFAALSNADQLPPWASQGGVATPATASCTGATAIPCRYRSATVRGSRRTHSRST